MLNRYFLVALVLPQIFAAGCAKGNGDHHAQDAQPHQLDPSRTDSEAKDLAMNGQVYCESSDPADCSPSVAMLVAISLPSSVSQCTAFLVSPQIAITNSHCIPADLKAAGSDCTDRLWLYFPDLPGSPPVRTGCAQILAASTLPDTAQAVPDYAVIRLDQALTRAPMPISRNGFTDQSAYGIVKVDPQSTTAAIGAMNRSMCKAVHDSVLVPHSDRDDSANMAMGDCQIEHGNSGSPLVDAHGAALGLIQLMYQPDTLGSTLLQMSLPMLDASVGPLGAGTSFACLALPADTTHSPLSAQCAGDTTPADPQHTQAQALTAKIGKGLEDQLRRESAELNPAFEWSITEYKDAGLLSSGHDSSTTYAIPVPTCVEEPQALLKGHHRFFGGYQPQAELALTLPKMSVKMGFNRYLVPDFRLGHSSEFITTSLTYSPEELATKNTFAVVLHGEPDFLGERSTLYTQTLKPCSLSKQ